MGKYKDSNSLVEYNHLQLPKDRWAFTKNMNRKQFLKIRKVSEWVGGKYQVENNVTYDGKNYTPEESEILMAMYFFFDSNRVDHSL